MISSVYAMTTLDWTEQDKNNKKGSLSTLHFQQPCARFAFLLPAERHLQPTRKPTTDFIFLRGQLNQFFFSSLNPTQVSEVSFANLPGGFFIHYDHRYLPGIQLPSNIVACPDLLETCRDATMLVFVVPHQVNILAKKELLINPIGDK